MTHTTPHPASDDQFEAFDAAMHRGYYEDAILIARGALRRDPKGQFAGDWREMLADAREHYAS